jgi:hypothetical protein
VSKVGLPIYFKISRRELPRPSQHRPAVAGAPALFDKTALLVEHWSLRRASRAIATQIGRGHTGLDQVCVSA